MTRKVPFLAEEAIERDAEALLAEFSPARDVVIELPIPIEDIVEKHLKLRIGQIDAHGYANASSRSTSTAHASRRCSS